MTELPLGRRVPKDFDHVAKYPLMAAAMPAAPVPVTLGINWYTEMDHPRRDNSGRYWIGRTTFMGRNRGGHAVCLLPHGRNDPLGWWDYYDQGTEGACVGFAASRMMSLLNRKRYDARWLWHQAKAVDEWDDTMPGDTNGTSVRAACDVLRNVGHCRTDRGTRCPTDPTEGILENRWATNAQQVLDALGTPQRDYVIILNSWGRVWPHLTRMPATLLDRLLREDGEACLITDRITL